MLLDRSYVDLKNQVIKAERKLLNALGFVVHVHHPHKLIYAYLLALDCLDNHELMQKAWSYMNDGLRTDIFLRYRPETIACACIYLAARTVKRPVALPQQPFPWYEAFDASDRDVKDISLILLKLYCRARAPNWSRLNDVLTQLRFNPDSVFQKNLAAASESKEDKAKSALERKRREVERKAAEMEQKANGLSANKNADRNRNGLSEKVREKEQIRQIRTRSESSSRSRSHSRSPAEPKKFRSSPLYARRRRRQSASRDRGGSANVKRHHKSHRDKEERRKAKEIKRAEKDRRRRSRSRDDRRRLDRERNQREREKDIFQVLGKRRQDSESPEPISKYRRAQQIAFCVDMAFGWCFEACQTYAECL
ncbi:hypothetical protein AB6A40_004996 [Gnathostoma spinigerum]|uniref:Cyclin-like domain-containing protein n=1 Tax=Gnathostoma spinigerum TaxID=75299 RepID=A0ABD6ENN6_9BILA